MGHARHTTGATTMSDTSTQPTPSIDPAPVDPAEPILEAIGVTKSYRLGRRDFPLKG